MAACKYEYDGKHFDSLMELSNYIYKNKLDEIKNLPDILYSKLEDLYELLKSLRSNFFTKAKLKESVPTLKRENKEITSFLTSFEPKYGTSNTINILDFIDSEYCLVDGKRIIAPISTEDYIKQEVSLREEGQSAEEALAEVLKEIDHWDIIDEDSIFIHSLASSSYIAHEDSLSEFEDLFELGKTERFNYPESSKLASNLYFNLNLFIRKTHVDIPQSHLILNINLQCALENCDGLDKELFGHIDCIFVDKEGVLHIYNFKASSQNIGEWSATKLHKFKLGLILAQRLLEANSIYTKGALLHIVPIKMDYSEDFTKIESIKVKDPINITITSSGNYALLDAELQLKKFISSKVGFPEITTDISKRTNLAYTTLFPDGNVTSLGIERTAEEWIKSAPKSGETALIVITPIEGEVGHYYDLVINGKVIPISDKTYKTRNKQIKEEVIKHINELDSGKIYAILALRSAIDKSYNAGSSQFGNVRGFYGCAPSLEVNLSMYFKYKLKDNKVKDYEWEMIDSLLDYNIILFKNKSGLLDIIDLNSSYDLYSKYEFSGKNNTTLLGKYKSDSLVKMLTADFGNIEAARAMFLINEIIPELKVGDFTLGNLKIINSIKLGSCRTYNISEFNRNYFLTIVQELNKHIDDKFTNNFKDIKFTNPIESIIEIYSSLVGTKGELSSLEDLISKLKEVGIDALVDRKTEHEIKKALLDLMDTLHNNYLLIDNLQIINLANSNDKSTLTVAAKLFIELSKAYNYYARENLIYENSPLSFTSRNLFTAGTIPDSNVRIVVSNLRTTFNTMSEEIENEYNSNIRQLVMDFYNAAGYSKTRNSTVGDEAKVFQNLYLRNADGTNTLVFKNPYKRINDNVYLKDYERKFLKLALKYFYKVCPEGTRGPAGMSFSSDLDIEQFIDSHPEYLDVPLERADAATRRATMNLVSRVTDKYKRLWKYVKNPKELYDEFYAGTYSKEREVMQIRELDIVKMSIRNKFNIDPIHRDEYINDEKTGPEFFETNVENLLIDSLAALVETVLYNKFLITTKAIMLQLELMGEHSNLLAKKVIESELNYILDYLKINVFKLPIIEGKLQYIMDYLMPFRSLVSKVNLAGNLIAFVRDHINGLAENYSRAITKYLTDLDPEYVTLAYKYVLPHSNPNPMEVTILSALCVRYRLSNTDVSRITERLKTGRAGILNYENWMYSTMRLPDFVNRMVLFVARCMQDGVFDAFSVNDKQTLIYDWTKDKRFSLLAKGEDYIKSHPEQLNEYQKLQSEYYSRIIWYNNEHPDRSILFTDDLPTPYSNAEIISFLAVADNIYGAYDKSSKPLGEFSAIGLVFGMYTTWMNGIFNTTFLLPGEYFNAKRNKKPMLNDQGEPLYLDKYTNICTKEELPEGDEGTPLYDDVPGLIQGLISTIKELFGILADGDIKSVLEYIKTDDISKQNINKLIGDLLVTLLYLLVYKLALDPAYLNHKKQAEGEEIINNLMIEILYKSSSRAFDTFKGPLNILEFFGENTNPPMWLVPTKIVSDAGKMIFGKKTFGGFVTGNFGFARTVKDTYDLYHKSQL